MRHSKTGEKFLEVRVIDQSTREEVLCQLRGVWADTAPIPGDYVNLLEKEGNLTDSRALPSCVRKLTLTESNGHLLVIQPDLLLSPASLSTYFECPRKAVLSERLKFNIDMGYGNEEDDRGMKARFFGNILHLLFQKCITNGWGEITELSSALWEMLHENSVSLWSFAYTEAEAFKELEGRLREIHDWHETYIRPKNKSRATLPFKGVLGGPQGTQEANGAVLSLREVRGTEEYIYSPSLGLKGMVDVTVEVALHGWDGGAHSLVAPLELKSGKNWGQPAHRAQVVLYALMMSHYHKQQISVGLLHYLSGPFCTTNY